MHGACDFVCYIPAATMARRMKAAVAEIFFLPEGPIVFFFGFYVEEDECPSSEQMADE